MNRKRVAEAADVARAVAPSTGDNPVIVQLRGARARLKEAVESVEAFAQKARSGVRKADESLAARKQEAQSRVDDADRSIRILSEEAEARVKAADDFIRAREQEAQDQIRAADKYMEEAENIEDSLRSRLKSLKITEMPAFEKPELTRGTTTNPLFGLERELVKARRLLRQTEELADEYGQEIALELEEDSVFGLSSQILSAIEQLRLLREDEVTALRVDAYLLEHQVIEDERDRLHRLAKAMILVGGRGLRVSQRAIAIAYENEARSARSWLLIFRRSKHVAECNRLNAAYESLRVLNDRIAQTWTEVSSKWPTVTGTLVPSEAQSIGTLTQAPPLLPPWNYKETKPKPVFAPQNPRPPEQRNYCLRCGAKLTGKTRFCTKCGKPVA